MMQTRRCGSVGSGAQVPLGSVWRWRGSHIYLLPPALLTLISLLPCACSQLQLLEPTSPGACRKENFSLRSHCGYHGLRLGSAQQPLSTPDSLGSVSGLGALRSQSSGLVWGTGQSRACTWSAMALGQGPELQEGQGALRRKG